MSEVIVDNIESLAEKAKRYKKTIVDLGCGDAKFIYKLAKENPENLYIGIDSSDKLLKPVLKKVKSKPHKGGLENIFFVLSSVENLSSNTTRIADTLYINFPWGSLLEGIVKLQKEVIANSLSLCKSRCELILYLAYEEKYEANFALKRNLPELTFKYLNGEWKTKLKKYGVRNFQIETLTDAQKQNIHTSWGKELLAKRSREVFKITALLKGEAQKLEYSFYAYGHPNILANHKLTLEFTKDKDLSLRGDCIVGINANFQKEKLKEFSGNISVSIAIDDLVQTFKCFVNKDFDSDEELVLRKSSFNSKRTFGIRLNHGASKLDRKIVEKLKNVENKMLVTIKN